MAIALVGLLTYAYKLSADGIFACPAIGYEHEAYLADCNAADYGDFDHGAFWFGLEPEAISSARTADVLFVGSSRMQLAFSTTATEHWFEMRPERPYLLGFSHSENAEFIGPLLGRIGVAPKALVINVDNFFQQRISPPAGALLGGGDIRQRYAAKQRWQPVHKWVCDMIQVLCGDAYAIYRNDVTGFWNRYGKLPGAIPKATATQVATDVDSWPERVHRARDFINQVDLDPRCVLLTLVPSSVTPIEQAAYIAESLQLPLITPETAGLMTFDGSHLDNDSAERWSRAFFESAGRTLESCLNSPSPAYPGPSQ